MVATKPGAAPSARKAEFIEADQSDLPCPVPFAKTFPFVSDPNQNYKRAILSHMRGVSRSSRTLGTGCGGREGSADERCRRGRRSRVVLTSRRWRQVCGNAGDG